MAANPIITQQGLVAHQYQDIEPLGSTLPSAAGTAEAQLHFINGMIRAYQTTGRAEAKDLAEAALPALLDFLFRGAEVPSVVTAANSFTPNVAVAAKSPFNAAVIHYSSQFTFVNGETVIPSSLVHIVFRAMSLDAVLAFQNPYAPLLVGTNYPVDSYAYELSGGVRVKLVSNYNGPLIVVHSTKEGAVIDRGDVFDYWPDWKTLDETQIVSHGQLYLAAYEVFGQANNVFGGDTWLTASAAVRQQFIQVCGFADSSTYSPGIVPGVINFGNQPRVMLGRRGPAYTGMQTPSLFLSNGNLADAKKNSALLRDAQAAWKVQTAQPNTGPFAPVYHLQDEGVTQYGTAGTFDWSGPDERLTWGEFQYRPLADLITLALRTTDATLKAEAQTTAFNMIAWLAQDNIWHPMWHLFSDEYARCLERSVALAWYPFSTANANEYADLTNKGSALDYDEDDVVTPMLNQAFRWSRPLWSVPIDFSPPRPPLGPPTDFPQGAAQINRPDPHLAGLILLSITRLDALLRPDYDLTGPMAIELRAVLHKAMAQLEVMWIEDGEMAGTFSPDPANRIWYGRWHGDLLESLSFLAQWATPSNANRPSIRALALKWIGGMIDWAKINSSVDPDAQHYPWPFSHNWRSPLTESFEWSTSLFASFSGKEQRLSMRIRPRRSLGLTHTLTGADAIRYDAIILAKQNELLSVPQWHLAADLTEDVPAGRSYLMVDELPAGLFNPGDFVGFGEGNDLQFGQISSIVGLQVNLTIGVARAVPGSARLMATDSGLINASQSASRRTTTVMEAQVGFDMVPQEDRRELPDIAPAMTFTVGTDTREVILRKPNRRDVVTVGNTWNYASTADYINGPVRPINGEDAGRRTINGTWSLLNREEIRQHLGMLKRLHGRRYAAWLPSWTADFTLTRSSSLKERIYVQANAHTELGVLFDPTVAIFIEMRDGTIHVARVTQVIAQPNDVQLRLDRELPVAVDYSQVRMASLMYRVRQMSDTASLNWRTNRVAETQVSFISVSDEP